MTVKLAPPSKPESLLAYWTAPLFAGFLSATSLGLFYAVKPHSYEGSISNFFCFLPMAFFFAAAAQVNSQKQIRELRQRIEQLEAQPPKPLASLGVTNL